MRNDQIIVYTFESYKNFDVNFKIIKKTKLKKKLIKNISKISSYILMFFFFLKIEMINNL